MDAKQLQDEAEKAAAEAKRLHQLAEKENTRASAHTNDGDETRAAVELQEAQKLEEQAQVLEQKAQEASSNSAALAGLAAAKIRERDAYIAESKKTIDEMNREIKALSGGSMLL